MEYCSVFLNFEIHVAKSAYYILCFVLLLLICIIFLLYCFVFVFIVENLNCVFCICNKFNCNVMRKPNTSPVMEYRRDTGINEQFSGFRVCVAGRQTLHLAHDSIGTDAVRQCHDGSIPSLNCS
jgi:hypothetical protein